MREGRYCRARLCRLCEGPIVDGGAVYLSQKRDMEKLRRWWNAHLDTEYTRKQCTVCYFCVWDLRYADVHSGFKEPSDQAWWYLNKGSKASKYYSYYCGELLKPCSVKITPLSPKLLEEQEKQQKDVTRPHKCIYCPKTFFNFHCLLGHVRNFHPKKEIRCGNLHCRQFFHTLEEKLQHQEKEHPPKKGLLIKCFYCEKLNTNQKNYTAHLNTKHKGQLFRCEFNRVCKTFFKTKEERDAHIKEKHNFGKLFCCFCDRYFEDNNLQRNHMRKYHKDEALQCNASQRCPNYFKTEQDRQKHVLEKHSRAKRYGCPYCGKTLSRTDKMVKHIQEKHKEVVVRCDFRQCGIYFKTEQEKQKHKQEIHENHDFFCIYCDKTICSKRGFGRHLTGFHFKEEIIRCSYFKCATYFKSEEEKLAHTKEVHNAVADEKIGCIYCNKLISKYGFFQQHMLRLHADVFIKCNYHNLCSTYFKTEEEREKHVREEHLAKKKPIQCPYCNKVSANLECLKAHIMKQNHPNLVKCNYLRCRIAYFKNKEDLETHLEQKPNHKITRTPFPCPLCPNKYFNSKCALALHTKTKHGAIKNCPHCLKDCSNLFKLLICKNCKKKFLCPGLLKSHKEKCILRCPVCAKTLKKTHNLMVHCKKKHTVHIQKWRGLEYESSGFKCDECFVYFKYKYEVPHHIKNVHTRFEADCHFCNRHMTKRSTLILHMAKCHLK